MTGSAGVGVLVAITAVGALAAAGQPVDDPGAIGSTTRLAGAATAWVVKGFVTMVAATLLAIMIVIVRSANRRL